MTLIWSLYGCDLHNKKGNLWVSGVIEAGRKNDKNGKNGKNDKNGDSIWRRWWQFSITKKNPWELEVAGELKTKSIKNSFFLPFIINYVNQQILVVMNVAGVMISNLTFTKMNPLVMAKMKVKTRPDTQPQHSVSIRL